MIIELKQELQQFADPVQKDILQRFFKTGPGDYGEGDIFLGIKVPIQRKISKKYTEMPQEELQELLTSPVHEHRFTALLLLIHQYSQGQPTQKKAIFESYLENIHFVNHWDLVDLSAPPIVGDYLQAQSRKILYSLATSKSLWKRRIAIIATLTFIRNNDFEETLTLAKRLLHDEHDLIHKAVGWMLREVGKRDQSVEEKFLNEYCKAMPRVMLRYAIERFDDDKRRLYLDW